MPKHNQLQLLLHDVPKTNTSTKLGICVKYSMHTYGEVCVYVCAIYEEYAFKYLPCTQWSNIQTTDGDYYRLNLTSQNKQKIEDFSTSSKKGRGIK